MNNNTKNKVIVGSGLVACLAVSSVFYFKENSVARNLNDEALLSIIKNDQKAFESYIAAGGTLGAKLELEGGQYNVGELIVKHELLGFVKYANTQKLKFESDANKDFDVYSIAVSKNNPEILSLLTYSQTNLAANTYGPKDWNLLQLASADCSYKVIPVLHKAGMTWDQKAKDGATALTIAAESGCLQALSYWKEQGADFKAKDGRGMTALKYLSQSKDAAIAAFAMSFMDKTRAPASVGASAGEPNFYKKRHIPKDNLADRAHLIEPEDRPEEANETAEYSEFAD